MNFVAREGRVFVTPCGANAPTRAHFTRYADYRLASKQLMNISRVAGAVTVQLSKGTAVVTVTRDVNGYTRYVVLFSAYNRLYTLEYFQVDSTKGCPTKESTFHGRYGSAVARRRPSTALPFGATHRMTTFGPMIVLRTHPQCPGTFCRF